MRVELLQFLELVLDDRELILCFSRLAVERSDCLDGCHTNGGLSPDSCFVARGVCRAGFLVPGGVNLTKTRNPNGTGRRDIQLRTLRGTEPDDCIAAGTLVVLAL